MPEVRADLAFESTAALATVDLLGTALEEVVANFQTNFDASLATVDASISALGATPIEEQIVADPSEAVAAINEVDTAAGTAQQSLFDLGAAGETSLGDVSAAAQDAASGLDDVDASAQSASDGLASVGDSAQSATGGTDVAKKSAEGLGAAFGLTAGSTEGLTGALGKLPGGAGAAVGPLAAVLAATVGLAEEGLKAVSAEERFNTILGESAKAVEDVRVGTLTGNIFTLGLQFGSTRAEIQESVATIYQHATAAGFATGKSQEYTAELFAMGARAVALKPSLGNVGDVIDSLETKFARSRGLVQYGISISQADINTRALTASQKTSVADLTVQDKAYAGLAIATEKYGANLSEVVAKGAENAANQQKSLTATLKDAIEELGKPLVAPFLEVMKDLIPVGIAAGQIIATLGKDLLPALAAVLSIVGPGLKVVGDAFAAIPPDVILLIDPLTTAIGAFKILDDVTGGALSSAADAVAGFASDVGNFLGITSSKVNLTKDDIAALGQQTVGSLNVAATQLAKVSDSLGNIKPQVLEELRQVAAKNIDTATRLGTAYVQAGIITQAALDKVLTSHQKAAGAAHDLAVQTQIGADVQQKTAAQIQATAALEESLAAATGKTTKQVSAAAEGYLAASQAASDYKTTLDVLNAGTLTLSEADQAQLKAQENLAGAFKDSKGSIDPLNAAYTDTYGQLLRTTRAVEAQNVAFVGAGQAEKATANINAYTSGLVDLLQQSGATPEAIGAMLAKLGLVGSVTDPATRSLLGLADMAGTTLPGDVRSGVDAAGNKLGELPGKVGTVLDGTSLKVNGWDFSELMGDIGANAGYNLVLNMSNNIDRYAHYVTDSVDALITKVKVHFEVSSPSKVFQRIGAANAEGLIGSMVAGFDSGASDVVAAAERITQAAAGVGLASPASSGAGLGTAAGGGGGGGIGPINVTVQGVSDPTLANAAGHAVGQGIVAELDGLTLRKIAIRARTG